MQVLKELKERVIETADRKVSEQIKRRREAPKERRHDASTKGRVCSAVGVACQVGRPRILS